MTSLLHFTFVDNSQWTLQMILKTQMLFPFYVESEDNRRWTKYFIDQIVIISKPIIFSSDQD